MKLFLMAGIGLLLTNCGRVTPQSSEKNQLDSINQQLKNAYKPGLGEFMSSIQTHHGKLWFAGANENWELADFEMNEIAESVDAIKQYCSNRPESKQLDKYLPAALTAINEAIQQKNVRAFKEKFLFLTNSCNECHKANSFGFNVVTIPTAPPVTNQDFKKVK